MEFKEFTAKTVEDAITEATIELGVTSDNLEYQVVKEGSSGLFGMFAKQAVIKARVKEITAAAEATDKKAEPEKKAEQVKEKIKTAVKDKKEPEKKVPVQEAKAEVKAEEKPVKKVSGKNDTESSELKGILSDFLGQVLEKMDCQAQVQVEIDDTERTIDINLEGNTGDIIGKRGATLDALQYLASIVANREKENYYRLKLDTKNYRERRAKTLENLARNVAGKVKKTKRKVVLEPMNPYERRIIHAYLQSDSQVTTKSEGEEPNRRVVVYYKR